MAKFTEIKPINLPDLNYIYKSGGFNYGTSSEQENNKNMLISIKRNYGKSIEKWANELELPQRFLIAFIAVESNGKMVGKNGAGAIGLTQVTSTAIREAVSKFKQITGTDLPIEVKAEIKAKAPYLLALTPNNQTLSSANNAKLESLLKTSADFNILMGAIVLRWSLDITKGGGYVHLSKAIIAYNQSAYGAISKYKNKEVSSLTLFKDKKIPKETRDYLVKVLGVSGFLHIYNLNDL